SRPGSTSCPTCSGTTATACAARCSSARCAPGSAPTSRCGSSCASSRPARSRRSRSTAWSSAVRASFDSRETARVSRFARDDEVAAWREDGWVVLEGLIDTDLIDAALDDLHRIFPRPEEFHADPARYTPPGRSDEDLRRGYPPTPES